MVPAAALRAQRGRQRDARKTRVECTQHSPWARFVPPLNSTIDQNETSLKQRGWTETCGVNRLGTDVTFFEARIEHTHLFLGGHLPHATRGHVHVLTQPPEPGLAHDLHGEASPRGGYAVADPPLAQVNPAIGPLPELFQEYVLVDCLLALLVLAPSGVVGKKAVPRPLFLLLRLFRLKCTEGAGISAAIFLLRSGPLAYRCPS